MRKPIHISGTRDKEMQKLCPQEAFFWMSVKSRTWQLLRVTNEKKFLGEWGYTEPKVSVKINVF